MNLYKYYPIPSDRMGFLWSLTSIEDCYVIEFGPAGTTHFAIEGIMELNAEHKMNVYTTHISEVDITFGRHDKLAKAISEVDKKSSPKYIFVMASSVTSLIGIDIESICMELKEVTKATLIPAPYGGYDGDYNLGVERALLSLAKYVVKPNKPQEMLYNIIGNNIDSYNFLSDATELEHILDKTFGLKQNTCFTAYTSIEKIEQASRAKYNIVIRAEGLPCAEFMKEQFGIPYVYQKPYGASKTLEWLVNIAKEFTLKADLTYVREQTEEIRKYLSEYKRYLQSVKNKEVLVYGEYDTVIGIKDMLNEMGLACNKVFVKHEMAEKGAGIHIKPTEAMLKEEMEKDYYAVLGDEVLRTLCGKAPFLQIANPNLNHYNFYRHSPLVGFNGTLRVLQEFMNLERNR